MATELAPFQRHPSGTGHRGAVEALALVAATVPLPPATAAALRLVCRATKLAVDHATKVVSLSLGAAEELLAVGNPLTSGLTSLRCARGKTEEFCSISGFYNACLMAFKNSQTLEDLLLCPYLAVNCPSDACVALGMLGAKGWPKLRSMEIFCIPRIFDRYIMLNTAPFLIEMRLTGRLGPRDIAALAAAEGLAARLEVLQLGVCDSEEHVIEYFALLKGLLLATPRLRRLAMSICART